MTSKASALANCAALFVFLNVGLWAAARESAAQGNVRQESATVRITRISANRGFIKGDTANLPGPASEYVVAVYVEADKWYIHPFIGKTAPIGENGQWRIDHVLRGNERQLSAVVLPSTLELPTPQLRSLGDLPAVARTTRAYESEWELGKKQAPWPPGVSVRITSCDASERLIEGEVANLPDPVSEYVVAVYVKTDDWYVHPFTGLTAPIGENGQWRIDHVLRGGEQQLGAVVLPRSPEPPAPRVGLLEGLSVIARTIIPYPPSSQSEGNHRPGNREARKVGVPPPKRISTPPERAKGPSVRVTRISASGGVIEGEVASLPGPANDYVVAVYVKTDDWYIHPFTASTAPIGENGQWRIDHVLRGGELQLGAVVLRRSTHPPAPRLGSLDPLPAVAKTTVPYQREYKPPRKLPDRAGDHRQRPEPRQEGAAPPASAKGPSVRITRISASRGVIEGEVADLPGPAEEYVVAVYVKTDDWYIHPFTGSTAPVGENGQWRIDHVLRGGEQQLGAVVVRRSTDPPAPRLGSLGLLPAAAKTTVPYQSEYVAKPAPPAREGDDRGSLR
ncbi:MAG: hypothetical protein ACYTG0_05025 [Planctomycetota bacterium]|jgi:hypothetical protein